MVHADCPLCEWVSPSDETLIALHQLKMHETDAHKSSPVPATGQDQGIPIPEVVNDNKNTDIPNEVKELLIANPLNDTQVYKNKVVNDIYHQCNGKVRTLTLLKYIRGQRESRFKLENSLTGLELMQSRYYTSKDGHWMNSRKFTDDGFVLTTKCVNRVVKTVEWLDNMINNYETGISYLKKKKEDILNKGDLKEHHRNESVFLDELAERKEAVLSFLGNLRSTMNSKLRAIPAGVKALAEKSDVSHKRKRTKENKKRKDKDRRENNYKQSNACSCLGLRVAQQDIKR